MRAKLKEKIRKRGKKYVPNQIRILTEFAAHIRPRPDLDIDEWSDQYRIIARGSASEAGQWRTSRFPFLREIMKCLSPAHPCQTVAIQKGSQIGATEVALNWVFYTIDYNPTSMLLIEPTLDVARKVTKQRVDKAIEAMPVIKDRVRKGNNALEKNYDGGIFIIGGANSAASLRSMPIEYLVLDEEDAYDEDVQKEGSPIYLAQRRTANYPNRKILRMSTPTHAETSTIEPAYEAGDQRKYYVVCPGCGHCAPIEWKESSMEVKEFTFSWRGESIKEAKESIGLVCHSCGMMIDERYKPYIMDPENGAGWRTHNPNGEYPSFYLPSFYSPIGFYSWRDIVADWLDAVRTFDKIKLKSVINTVFGQTYSEKNKDISSSMIETRRENYFPGKPQHERPDVPAGAAILTAGGDVQQNRIEIEIVAYGKGYESWSIEYLVFHGDPAQEFVWSQIEQYFSQRVYTHENGSKMYLAIMLIDSKFKTEIVNKFCKRNEHRRWFPVQGRDGWGRGYIERPKRKNKYGTWSFYAWVDELKSKIYSQLMINDPGPEYCHFPDKPEYDKHYFSMLTAESLVTKYVQGKNRLRWELPKGQRNEALDCRVYAYAGLVVLGPQIETMLKELNEPITAQNAQVQTKRGRRVRSMGVKQ
jgi:phage terminase large subunit GpA-like protein